MISYHPSFKRCATKDYFEARYVLTACLEKPSVSVTGEAGFFTTKNR